MKRILLNFYHLLKRHKVVALLNIIGLSLAFTVIIIVSIQVNYDYGYNSSIPNSDKVFQLRTYSSVTKTYSHYASCPLVKRLTANIPEVEHVGMASFYDEALFNDENGDDTKEFRLKCLYGTNSLLPILNPTILSGDTINIAQRKLTLILTKSTAMKLFGTIECIGKSLNKNRYQVNAVIEDIPRNNSTRCDAIFLVETRSNDWSEGSYYAYMSIDPKAKELVNSKLNGEGMPIDSSLIYQGERWKVGIDNVKDIYLSSLPEIRLGNPTTTTLTLLSVGILVLLIALANLLNLAIALTPARMRMLNTQRVLGLSKRAQQIGIVFESVFFVILSFAISLCFLYAFGKTDLIRLFDASFDISYNIKLIAVIGCGLVAFSILTGLYPAHYATSFPLATVLKGSFAMSSHGVLLRRILLTAQFAISITILIIGISIDSQHKYMQNKSWGINPENVVYFEYVHRDTTSQIYYDQPIAIVDELLKNPNITDEAFARYIPESQFMGWGRDFEGIPIQIKSWPVSHNFLEFFGIELKLGETMKGFK
ncbi:MAG: FtsX-like permease family protein, partial [Tannerellaceae bacterium]